MTKKDYRNIIKWGKIKPFFKDRYKFNSIDIETINNELFILGCTINGKYKYYEDNFYDNFHDILLISMRGNRDILSWSRYDNTHIIKLLLSQLPPDEREKCLLRVGKVTPIHNYQYDGFDITIENIIKYSIIFTIKVKGKKKKVTIYNMKNLFSSDIEKTAENYQISWYSKIGTEYHIIDKNRYLSDFEYKNKVLLSNELDNKVLIAIMEKLLKNFKDWTGKYPGSIFTAGSIARSFLVAFKSDFGDASNLSFLNIFKDIDQNKFNRLLDYSMQAYYGGKVESYAIGYIKDAYIIDKNSAYPAALIQLPKLTNEIIIHDGDQGLDNYFYAFVRCNITIKDKKFIHPIIIKNPVNNVNISPYGYLKNIVITKYEYDYLKKFNQKVEVLDYVAVKHEQNNYPYKHIIELLINDRYTTTNKSRADLDKTIVNCIYGITCELTPIYDESDDGFEIKGYRAGDFFNPVIASYITAMTRCDLSMVDNNIIENGGEIYLNMTDSIVYHGYVTLDIFSKTKVLGKYSIPEKISDLYVLGTGRYQYTNKNGEYIVKNRGFSAIRNTAGFYNEIDITEKINIPITTFVTIFKATTEKYDFNDMGAILPDDYEIQPFNLGGKRKIVNKDIDLNKEYTLTDPLYIDEFFDHDSIKQVE